MLGGVHRLERMLVVNLWTAVGFVVCFAGSLVCLQVACRNAAEAQSRHLRATEDMRVAYRNGEHALLLKL